MNLREVTTHLIGMRRPISDRDLTFIGQGNWRDRTGPIGIRRADRRAHMYLVGKTGTGKSTLLATMLQQDIRNGEGAALLDPHGDLVERVHAGVPESRRGDLIYFDVADDAHPLTWNPLEGVPAGRRSVAASGMLEAMKKLWPDSWGPRLEHILRNALLALLEFPQAHLAHILRLVGDADFRKTVAQRVENDQVREFWLSEFAQYNPRFRVEAIAPLQNKVGAFLADPRLNRILTSPKSSFDLRKVMDEGKILLVNLSKGKIGEDASALLGTLLVAQIGVVGLGRANMPEADRPDFYVYLDEFQGFATLSLAAMLAELRKYRVNLILAHQYLGQLEPEMRDAVLGNAGTMVCFRIGAQDAEKVGQEFSPEFEVLDLTRLPNYEFAVKLMVDGAPVVPFSGRTLGP